MNVYPVSRTLWKRGERGFSGQVVVVALPRDFDHGYMHVMHTVQDIKSMEMAANIVGTFPGLSFLRF